MADRNKDSPSPSPSICESPVSTKENQIKKT